MNKTFTIKSWGTTLHFVLRGTSDQPSYAPAFFVMKYLLILLLLAGCSKEYSRECRACETEVTVIREGKQVGVARYEVACDTAKIGEQIIHGPTVTWVYKTSCK